jgi:methionyl-tRNA synthetase
MTTENILVCVAWPYANGDLHVGHIAGAYLPADIFARYQRLKGGRVLMVSGSDAHGTPIVVRAEKEGKTPREVFEYYHARFLHVAAPARHLLRPVYPYRHREPSRHQPADVPPAAG